MIIFFENFWSDWHSLFLLSSPSAWRHCISLVSASGPEGSRKRKREQQLFITAQRQELFLQASTAERLTATGWLWWGGAGHLSATRLSPAEENSQFSIQPRHDTQPLSAAGREGGRTEVRHVDHRVATLTQAADSNNQNDTNNSSHGNNDAKKKWRKEDREAIGQEPNRVWRASSGGDVIDSKVEQRAAGLRRTPWLFSSAVLRESCGRWNWTIAGFSF